MARSGDLARSAEDRIAELDRVWALTPGGAPDVEVVVAASKAGALGVLDLGSDRADALAALTAVDIRTRRSFGVRLNATLDLLPQDLPRSVDTVLLTSGQLAERWCSPQWRLFAEVVSVDEAVVAVHAGVAGVVVRGREGGGRAGDQAALVLAAEVLTALTEAGVDGPVWVLGGIDAAGAADAARLGAAGVVLADQLAGTREATAGPVADTADGRAAGDVARRYRTVGRAVQGVRAAFVDALAGRDGAAPWLPDAAPVDVAIVGMACVMPGAADVETFWSNIVDGVDAVTEVSPARWDPALHFDPDFDPSTIAKVPTPKTVSKWGGWMPDVEFDALAWGIPPSSLAAIDPVQLLALKAAKDALVDAGYDPTDADGGFDRDRASVVYASGSGGATDLPAGYAMRSFLPNHFGGELPPELDAYLPRLTEDAFPGVLTSVIAGRVANRLDLGGKNLTVDAACASTVAALDIACRELVAGGSDVVLCGGADLHNALHDFYYFTAVQALAASGRCRSFDAAADGMTLGEGVGCLVLKRLADAERDGDRVYAVVKAVAGSSDGCSLGLTAPRQQGQEKSLRRAYAAAGISPAEVGLIEAHGTGTVAGDRTELRTLTEVFTESGASPSSVVLGSVKSNIGHIKCAAGIAGLIKAAKALYHGVLPPTLHVTRPNDAWDGETSPFVFLDHARPWLDQSRVAGVSAFGFGGTNFHAVLTSYDDAPVPASGRECWPGELFVVRGRTDSDVDCALDEVIKRSKAEAVRALKVERFHLRDVAAAVTAAGSGPVRLAFVATSWRDLYDKVKAARARQPHDGLHWSSDETAVDVPPVAFLFAGESTVRPGMAADLLTTFPRARRVARLGWQWTDAVLPPAAFGDVGARAQTNALNEPGVAEPALALAQLTVTEVLESLGVRMDAGAGSGTGELVAHCVAGDFDARVLLDPDADVSELLEALEAPGAGSNVYPAPEDGGPAEQIAALYADGYRVFVDVGPSDRLAGLVGSVLGDQPHVAVAVDVPGQHGVTSLLDALARLAVAGVTVDIEALYADRNVDPDRCLHPPAAAGWVVNGQYVRTAATGLPLAGGLQPADAAPQIERGELVPLTATAIPGPPVAVGSNDAGLNDVVLLEYLRTTNELIVTGSDIIRNVLGLELPFAAGLPLPAAPAAPTPSVPAEPTRNLSVAPAAVASPEPTRNQSVAPAAVAKGNPLDVAQALLSDPATLLERLVEIVSERTGYPPDMLDPDLDVEADLSIDSIKRIEILGELAERIGLGTDGNLDQLESLVEELASRKTLRSIVAWLVERADVLAGVSAGGVSAGVSAGGVSAGVSAGSDLAPASASNQ